MLIVCKYRYMFNKIFKKKKKGQEAIKTATWTD